MKPGSISKKVEGLLSMHKLKNNNDQTQKVADDNNDDDQDSRLKELNEEILLRSSGGAKELKSVIQLKIIGFTSLQQIGTVFESVISLKILNLSFSGIRKIEGLTKCVQLTHAILSNNRITSMSGLQECKQLAQLDLSQNEIEEIEGINGLNKLTVLNISGNQISLINSIDSLKNLTQLLLGQNKIKKIDFFPQLPSLVELDLSQNHIEQIHPKLFENLKTLESLDISNNKLRSVDFLNGLPQLERLKCANNSIEKIIMKIQFEDMEHLDFSGNQILETKRFEEFFPNLFTLDISGNNIFTEDELDFVYDMENLCEIDFSKNLICTSEFVDTFIRRHPEIDVVNNKIIHEAGHRFELEMEEVKDEIIEFEKREKIRLIKEQLIVQTTENDQNKQDSQDRQQEVSNENVSPNMQVKVKQLQDKEIILEDTQEVKEILQKHGIKNLEQLMKDIKKEKETEKQSIEQFLSYYKHMSEDIAVTKKKETQKYRDDEDESDNPSEEDNEDEDNKDEEEMERNLNNLKYQQKFSSESKRQHDLNKQQAQQMIQEEKQRGLAKFDEYVTLEDEATLNGFITDLNQDLSEITASYQAIKGIKHIQRHRSLSNISNSSKIKDNQNKDQDDPLNSSQLSFKSNKTDQTSDVRSSLKNVIVKSRIPVSSSQLSGTQRINSMNRMDGQSVRSSVSGQLPYVRGNQLSKTQQLPMQPIRNVVLQRELNQLKKNINDQEFLKKIGFSQQSDITSNSEQDRNFSSTLKTPLSAKSQISKTSVKQNGRIIRERSGSAQSGNKQFSQTMKEESLGNRKVTQNQDNNKTKKDEFSLSETQIGQPSPGIIYSNRNSKTKSRLIDAISASQNNSKM